MPISRVPHEMFFLDRTSSRSLQAQIGDAVVTAILSQQASAGARMPSSRRLADHLGVARMTVTLAYQELVSRGFLEPLARKGYVVADTDTVDNVGPVDHDPHPARPNSWDNILTNSLATRRRIVKPPNWRSLPYPFVYGQMDTSLFNHAAWRDCVRQATGRRDFDDMAGDLVASDDPLLVNYVRSRTLPRRGITVEADQILITVGAQHALWLAIELLTRQPLKAVCENPGYPDLLQSLRWCGAEVTTLDVDDDGLPPDRIPEGTGAVFVSPSHHSPTGATMPPGRRRQLLREADEKDFVIVEDDYEFEMSFVEAPSPALKSLDRNDRVLYAGSFSKALFPGVRLGYLVGPRAVIAEARELRSMMLRHPPGHLQRTVAYFLAGGHYDLLIRNMRQSFARRRATLLKALEDTDLTVAGASRFGGSSLWVRGPAGLDSTRLARELLADGVVIEPGAPFFDTSEPTSEYFRLGYSSISVKQIEAGMALIARRVREHCA